MADYMIWIWVGVIVVSLLLEFASHDLTLIWFSVGGLVSLILSAINANVNTQIIVFILVSALLILTLRRWAKNKLLNSEGNTNLELIKKEKFKLQVEITDTQKGAVKYNDIIWTAISFDGKPIAEGEWVTVEEIKGNKLIVKKAKKEGK